MVDDTPNGGRLNLSGRRCRRRIRASGCPTPEGPSAPGSCRTARAGFRRGCVSRAGDGRQVGEDVRTAAVLADEAKALVAVEPCHGNCDHVCSLAGCSDRTMRPHAATLITRLGNDTKEKAPAWVLARPPGTETSTEIKLQLTHRSTAFAARRHHRAAVVTALRHVARFRSPRRGGRAARRAGHRSLNLDVGVKDGSAAPGVRRVDGGSTRRRDHRRRRT